MSKLLKKIIFLLNKPAVILVAGNNYSFAVEAISRVLASHFNVREFSNGNFPFCRDKNEILIFKTDFKNLKDLGDFQFLLKKSRLPILVATYTGSVSEDKTLFTGEKKDAFPIQKIAEILPSYGFAILNFDDETIRNIKNETIARCLTYGLQGGADFQVTDVNVSFEGTNFKVNHEGNTVPFWLGNHLGKEQIYGVLAGVCIGVIKEINLVEISQSLRDLKL